MLAVVVSPRQLSLLENAFVILHLRRLLLLICNWAGLPVGEVWPTSKTTLAGPEIEGESSTGLTNPSAGLETGLAWLTRLPLLEVAFSSSTGT